VTVTVSVTAIVKASALVLAAGALLSCGEGAPSPGAPVPLEQMEARVRQALCAKVYSCCSATERQDNPAIGIDPASCEATLPGYATFLLGEVAVSVRAGRAVYHGDKLATCLANLQRQSCAQVKMTEGGLDVGDFCPGVIEPKVPLGGACLEYWDCIGGWCAGDLGDLKDHCEALQLDGGECDEEKECAGHSCTDAHTCAQREPDSGNLCRLGGEPPD
jgi:hypothetical protein